MNNANKSKFTINKSKQNLEPAPTVNSSEVLPPITSVDVSVAVTDVQPAEWFTAVGVSLNKDTNTYYVEILEVDKNSNMYKVTERIESGNNRAYANERLKIEIIKKIINKEVI